jgi:dihydroflavonol-4-reductase
MVTAQPSTMIGPNAARLTDSMQFISDIKNKRLAIDPNFFFNFVDVRDVAAGLIAAASKGKSGQRYLLTNQTSTSMQQIIAAANDFAPGYKVPPRPPQWLLSGIARCFELVAKISGKPADLITSQVALFYGVRQEYDSSKARNELGYAPVSPQQALLETFRYLELRQG